MKAITIIVITILVIYCISQHMAIKTLKLALNEAFQNKK